MPNFDDFKLAIEAMTGGKNTVLFDDMGMPSVMVPFPKMKIVCKYLPQRIRSVLQEEIADPVLYPLYG